jgi:DNA-directed RNA polymerase subunit beta
LHVRIDRRRKMPVTTLLLALVLHQDDADAPEPRRDDLAALGLTENDVRLLEHDAEAKRRTYALLPEGVLKLFYDHVIYVRSGQGWKQPFRPERLRGQKLTSDLVDAASGDVLAEAGTKLTPRLLKRLAEQGLRDVYVSSEELVGRYVAVDLIDQKTGLVHAEAGDELTPELLAKLVQAELAELPVLDIDHVTVGPYMRNTLAADRSTSREDALLDIYRVLRPGEPPNLDTAETLFHGLFFDSERYDLSPVGRVKMNARLGFETEDTS